MLLLKAVNIKKYYHDRLILFCERLEVHAGDKIGIVGQNGAGKTTLLNILAGEVEADEGTVTRHCDVAYLRQLAYQDRKQDRNTSEENESKSDEEENSLEKLKILKELGVKDKLGASLVSGGEQTRLEMAQALSKGRLILLADEPTTNLDVQGIDLLKEKLKQVETLLLISHDRTLLDEFCHKIIEVRNGKLAFYEGNFSAYLEQKRKQEGRAQAEYEQYLQEKRKLEGAIRRQREKAKSTRKAPARMGNSEARLHKGTVQEKQKKLHRTVNSLKTRLEQLKVKEKPKVEPVIKLDFSLTDPPRNKIVISCEDLCFSYGQNEIFRHAAFKLYNGSRTALVGPNGSGKTTLLNLIYQQAMGTRESREIYLVPKARIGYFFQGFENLDYDRTILENVREDSVQDETTIRTILARLLFIGDDVYKKVGVLSGGEKIKVAFAKLFVSRANVLLLDEPTNYLDFSSLEALQKILKIYEGTVLFVSHDRAFVEAVADRLLLIENKKILELAGYGQAQEEGGPNASGDREDTAEELTRSILQMRLSEIITKMSFPNASKELLEEEYQKILVQLKMMNKTINKN